jgi:hypothetical protein
MDKMYQRESHFDWDNRGNQGVVWTNTNRW